MNAMDVIPDIQPTLTSTAVESTPTTNEFVVKRMARAMMSNLVERAAESDMPERQAVASMLSYLFNPFVILCMAMAIILNRTIVFATTRRPTQLTVGYRATLRFVAIWFLAAQLSPIFAAMKCSDEFGKMLPASWEPTECPSPHMLWNLYRAICVGHFIETFSSVIQGRIPYSETGMTLFEYSVAFQEVQSASKLSPEILVISLLSVLNQLALHTQGMFNSYKYRLVPSSIFGVSFLCFFAYAIYQGRLFYFPRICIVGYLPQLMICIVVIICGAIYALASSIAGADNMRNSLTAVQFDMSEDFYSCFMKLGVVALTSVSRATYLTEAAALSAPLSTWIERQDTASKDVVNPYLNEVRRQPPTKGETHDPSSIVMFNRVLIALQMGQALATICIYSVWRLICDTVYKLAGVRRRQQDHDESATLVEDEIMRLRNHAIYADLDKDYESSAAKLLAGDLIPDFDDSVDYEPDSESEAESDYYTSDAEVAPTTSFAAQQRAAGMGTGTGTGTVTPSSQQQSVVSEVYDLIMSTPDALLSLLVPQSSDEAETAQILSSHLAARESRVTRSRYHDMHKNDPSIVIDLIKEHRKEVDPALAQTVCVVCHCNPRQVILWPCRCFALCEECRLGLAVKNFKGCVCCRRDVDSFSRVFVP